MMKLEFFTFAVNIACFHGLICAIHGPEYDISGHHFSPFSETFTLFCDCGERLANIIDLEIPTTESQSDGAERDSNHIIEDKVTSINIYRGTGSQNSILVVEDNVLLNTDVGIYSYDNNLRNLNISNVPDDVAYVCSCLREYVSNRRWEWTRGVNYLYIINGSTAGMPQCFLITGVDGVLIAGVGVELRCKFNETVNITLQGNSGSTVVTREVNSSECSANGYCSYFFSNTTVEYNETKLICLPVGEMTGVRDMCSHIPKLFVIPRFTLSLISDSDMVSEGGNVTFTCSSNSPVMTHVIEWQSNDDFQGNFDLSENSGQSQLTISNFRCNSSANNEIKVSCKMIFSDHVMSREELSVNTEKAGTLRAIGLNAVNVFIIAIVASAAGVVFSLCFLLVMVRKCGPTTRKKHNRRSDNMSPELHQISNTHQPHQQQPHHGDQQQVQDNQRQHHNDRDDVDIMEEEDDDDYDYDYSVAAIPQRTSSHYNHPGSYENVKENVMWSHKHYNN